MRNSNNTSVPVSEMYWSLVAKADKKFSKIRDLPYYERNRYDTYFSKVFKAYTQLWKFQQENRQKLVEAGLKRWEIGDIASRIGQLYFGQYMRTSDRSYLSESYIFYEAVLTREYFRDGFSQDLNLAIKQLRFLARFLTVCLVMSRREMVFQLVNQLKMLLDECKRIFQETDFREWKVVVQEIGKFLKADTGLMNFRPLRYSLVLDRHPDYIPHIADAKRKLKLREAILCSYHPNEIKFSELTLDTFRMLQCLEWEPSGSFYQSTGAASGTVHKGASGPSRINYTQDIADPTLPANPRKAMLYRPSATHFIAVLATLCEELPPDGVLLVYVSASGSIGHLGNADNNILNSELGYMQLEEASTPTGCLQIGARGDGEKGERIAMLLSPTFSSPTPGLLDSIPQPSGSMFTSFLTAPLQAFLMLIGISGSDIEMGGEEMRNSNNTSVPVSEMYWSLVAKADKKFSKIRDLPYYERNRYDTYFSKVFKAYTQLWKFQQENRQKLVEAGLKRWEIGDIASRIGQLYFGQYMRTSDRSYLSESYIFYEAVLTREYFRDGFSQDLNLAIKQLRFLARFLTVCLVMSRREMVFQLVNQLKMLLDECKRIFQETDFREWKVVVQEIGKFLKADTGLMNFRPLRYSLVLDRHPDYIPHIADAKRKLKLREAILCSYHPNEIKFSELTLDTFRMLQCLEWEPSGSFYQSTGAASGTVHKGASGPSRINYTQDIADPTLPANPRKAMLYRPSATHFIAVLATLCEELPPDGVLLVYVSASGSIGHLGNADNNILNSELGYMQLEEASTPTGCLQIGARGDGGHKWNRKRRAYCDASVSNLFVSYTWTFRFYSSAKWKHVYQFPHSSFAGFSYDLYNKGDKLLSSLLDHWGSVLITSEGLDLVWVQVLSDPFLRRLLLRFMFCQTVLTLHAHTFNKKEYLPQCLPCLPKAVSPVTAASQTALLQIASVFGASNRFIFSEGITIHGDAQTAIDEPIST
uniref:Protein SCAI n=1 Tax=Daucus carota subsp. sativus TaxID=79200 RepID=A0A161ZNL1_DAUCS